MRGSPTSRAAMPCHHYTDRESIWRLPGDLERTRLHERGQPAVVFGEFRPAPPVTRSAGDKVWSGALAPCSPGPCGRRRVKACSRNSLSTFPSWSLPTRPRFEDSAAVSFGRKPMPGSAAAKQKMTAEMPKNAMAARRFRVFS